MADSIEMVRAEISSELGEIQSLIEEGGRLQAQISDLCSKTFALAFPRWDSEVLRGMADEFGIMAQLDKEERANTEALENISAELAEANIRHQSEPAELQARMTKILGMYKAARILREASVEKLREVRVEFEELLDQSTPKA